MSAEKRKLALVGFTVSRDDAPWDDPEWAVAGCNNLWAQTGMADKWPKAESWYDLHDSGTITGKTVAEPQMKKAAEEHTQWLREGKMPCWVMPAARQPDWPTAKDFPRDKILAWAKDLGLAGPRYFTNSVSWMVAHAVYVSEVNGWSRNGAEIGMWGIDMAQSGEYAAQRPSCEYWLGIAEGLGIKVTVADRADLLKCVFLYGSEDEGHEFSYKMKARQIELQGRAQEAGQQADQLRAQLEQVVGMQNQIAGALDDCNYVLGVWMQPEGTRKGQDDPSIQASTASEPLLQAVPDG